MVARSTCLSYVGSTPSNEKTMVLRLAMDLKTVVLLGLQGVNKKIIQCYNQVRTMYNNCPEFRGG